MSFERTPPSWPPPPRGAPALGPRERFYCAWLEALALLHVAGGLAWPFLVGGTSWLDRWLPGLGAGRFWCALLGPTIASWGLVFWFVARHGLRQGRRWACDALIFAILTWLPLDFALCVRFGFTPGIVLDPIFGLAMLAPLFLMRRRLD